MSHNCPICGGNNTYLNSYQTKYYCSDCNQYYDDMDVKRHPSGLVKDTECEHHFEFIRTGKDEGSHMRGHYKCSKCGIEPGLEKSEDSKEEENCEVCGLKKDEHNYDFCMRYRQVPVAKETDPLDDLCCADCKKPVYRCICEKEPTDYEPDNWDDITNALIHNEPTDEECPECHKSDKVRPTGDSDKSDDFDCLRCDITFDKGSGKKQEVEPELIKKVRSPPKIREDEMTHISKGFGKKVKDKEVK